MVTPFCDLHDVFIIMGVVLREGWAVACSFRVCLSECLVNGAILNTKCNFGFLFYLSGVVFFCIFCFLWPSVSVLLLFTVLFGSVLDVSVKPFCRY